MEGTLAKVVLGTIRSLLLYPSCVFWASSLVTSLPHLAFCALYVFSGKSVPRFPTIPDILKERQWKIASEVCQAFGSACTLLVFLFVNNYFKRSLRSAAPAAKVKISHMLRSLHFVGAIFLVSYSSIPFAADQSQIQNISIFLCYISAPIFHTLAGRVLGIIEGTLEPSGYILDYLICVSAAQSPIFLALAKRHGTEKWMSAIGFLQLVEHFCFAMKSVTFGAAIFGTHFLKISDSGRL